jgi:transposase
MGTGRTAEFRKDAVRIAMTSGLSRKQIADDLGVGMSTLNKWITAHRGTDVVSREDRELARENERLRRENRMLREERDILKKPIRVHPLHRASGKSGHRAISWQRRRRLRQCFGRDHQWPLQNRGHS